MSYSLLRAQILIEGNFEAGVGSENINFFLLDERFDSFEESKEACIDNNGVIAIIDNIDKFNFVERLVNETGDLDFYIGLVRESVTESFEFVDNLQDNNKSFFLTPNTFPWQDFQPNNLNGEENCVEWELEDWRDVKCSSLISVICRRDCGGEKNGLIISDCINNEFEIVLFTDKLSFDEAILQCDSVNAKVARVKNKGEFDQIDKQFMSEFEVLIQSILLIHFRFLLVIMKTKLKTKVFLQ